MFLQQTPPDWASLAKEAMDAIGKGIQGVVDTVSKAAPLVWKMAVRQSWINGVEYLVGAIFLAGIARFFYGKCMNNNLPERADFDKDDAKALGLFIVLFSTVLIAVFTINALDYILNPQWQAIQILIKAAEAKGRW